MHESSYYIDYGDYVQMTKKELITWRAVWNEEYHRLCRIIEETTNKRGKEYKTFHGLAQAAFNQIASVDRAMSLLK